MKLRRLATAVAATTALVMSATAPAFADHVDEDPLLVDEGPGNVTCEDLGLDNLLEKVEGPVEGRENDQVITTVTDDEEGEPTFLDVEAKNGFEISAVIVKGSDASLVYFHGPFDGLTAPDEKEISHYVVCGNEVDDENGEEENGEEEEENGEEVEENGEEEPTEEPAAVPTEIPAGTGSAGGVGTAGTAGLVAMIAAFAAGAAVIVRRRFLTES